MSTLTQKSQVTVPKSIRDFLGVGPGDEVEFDVEDETVIVHKKQKLGVIDEYRGFLGKGRTKKIMAELR